MSQRDEAARHGAAKALFERARQVPAKERAAFVRQEAGDDQALAADVMSLLRFVDEETDSFAPVLLDGIEEAPSGPPRVEEGDRVAGRYLVAERLGVGGMGEVWRARDEWLGEDVALKFVGRGMPQAAERLVAEARVARGVAHPNVVRVHDVANDDGEVFLAMELVEGGDLAAQIQRAGALDSRAARKLAQDLVAGLGAIHDAGLLHRDLKPSNVLLGAQGNAQVSDFGLASSGAGIESLHGGTPGYMSPERRDGGGASTASDLWALGVVIAEAWCGRRVADEALDERGVPLLPQRRHGDPVLALVVRRLLDPNPERRPRTASQVARALGDPDPLSAVLSLGERPDSDVLRHAEARGFLSRRAGVLLTLGMIVLILGMAAFRDVALPLEGHDALGDPALDLEHARAVALSHGVDISSGHDAWGHVLTEDWTGMDSAMGGLLASESPVLFWYRWSSDPLVPRHSPRLLSGDGSVQPLDPSPTRPGSLLAVFDAYAEGEGALKLWMHVPSPSAPDKEATQSDAVVDASSGDSLDALARQTGWKPGEGLAVTPLPDVVVPGDRRQAFVAEDGRRWELASAAGRPTFAAVLAPNQASGWVYTGVTAESIFELLLTPLLALLALPLAWRHLRSGRTSPVGSLRLVALTITVEFIAWMLRCEHPGVPVLEFIQAGSGLVASLWTAFSIWMLYAALQPIAEARLPRSLISWNRALERGVRDPLVASHVLLGLALGLFNTAYTALSTTLVTWEPHDFDTDILTPLRGTGTALSVLAAVPAAGLYGAFQITALVVLFGYLDFRGKRPGVVGAAAIFLLFVALWIVDDVPMLEVVVRLPGLVMILGTLVWLGLLPCAMSLAAAFAMENYPITLQWGEWYAGLGAVPVVCVIAVAAWAAFRLK